MPRREFTLEECLVNPHHFGAKQHNKLRKKLIKHGVKDASCETCGVRQWMGKPAPIELDHIDGDKWNNELSNLRILCPNCHAQTDTYRGKNKARLAQRKRQDT